MDKILIRDLRVRAVIGTLPEERVAGQEIVIDLELQCDARKAGKSDNLTDAVDYSAVEDAVFRTVEKSSFFLLEALTEKIAETCLAFPGVRAVTVSAAKPAAARHSGTIALEITRRRRKS